MKKCSRCKQLLPLNNFSKNISQKDLLNNECKQCAKISQSKSNPKNLNELELIQKECRKLANNKDIAIQELLYLSNLINNFIDKNELEY